ncbi:MAG TPA: TolC family protein, partial [Polyangiaceae bacterium]
AYLRLQQLLDLPVGEPLELVSTLDDNALAPLAAHARRVIGARPEHAERAPVRQALEDSFARDAAIAAARASQLPFVDLYMTYGRVAYPEDLSPSWDDFRTNWVVGLSLSWTVFDGFRTSGNVQAAQGARDQALMDLRLAREAAAFEFVEASQELTASRAVWEASGSSAEEARKAYVIARLRYEEGVSTQLELSDARLRVQQALAERAQAARDFQVARVRVALLPALPFSSAPAAPLPVQTSPRAGAEESAAAVPAAAAGTNAAAPAGAGSARSP